MDKKKKNSSAHQDERVWLPVGWCNLVGEPGSDGLGRLDAQLGHGLRHEVYPIQEALGRVAVVLQEAVGLRRWEGASAFAGLLITSLEGLSDV